MENLYNREHPKLNDIETALQQTLELALVFHRKENFSEAKKLYNQILEIQADHFEALHLSGLIAHAWKQTIQAEDFFSRAIAINPYFAPLHYNYGLMLQDLNHFEQSIMSYDTAISLNPNYAEAYQNRGVIFLECKRFHEARDSYQKATIIRKRYASANFGYGLASQALKHFQDALASYEKTIIINPSFAEAYHNRAAVFNEMKQLPEAVSSYKTAVTIKPSYAEAYLNCGITLSELNLTSDAIYYYDSAIKMKLDYAEAYYNRGVSYCELGRFNEALISFEMAVFIKPGYAEAYYNKGATLHKLERYHEALDSHRKAIFLRPDYSESLYNSGLSFQELKQFFNALMFYKKALHIIPSYIEALNNSGVILHELKQFDEALASYSRALSIKPNYAQALNNQGVTLHEKKRFKDALLSYETALSLQPDFADAYYNRGLTLVELNFFDEALSNYDQAIICKSGFYSAHSNLLFTMNYIDKFSPFSRLERAKEYGAYVAVTSHQKFSRWDVNKNTSKIRIGLVSGDFNNHPVGYFLESVLSRIDQSKYELFAFMNNSHEDETTERLKSFFSCYNKIFGFSNMKVAEIIHSAGINILIDLSGHTALNRLPVFALKPAPVQVTWLGYFATTGVKEIDYILGDHFVIPVNEEHHFSEKIKRLPETYFCFTQPNVSLEINELPAIKNGHITFGCFNNFSKVNEEVISLWARLLIAVEGSRLFLKARQLQDPCILMRTIDTFRSLGVSSERLILEGQTSRLQYFKSYHKVDIGLDPFPYPGGTTSVESLWMGVPVITKKGKSFIAHNGETIAKNSGQEDWIALDESQYLEKAIHFSSDLKSLNDLRARLRGQILASPLFDAERFARNFELALSEMWTEYNREIKLKDPQTEIDEFQPDAVVSKISCRHSLTPNAR